MIVKPKLTNEEFFNEVVTSSKKSTMYNIKFGLFTKPIFKLESCTVKYPLGRFDKIIFEHEHSEFVKEFNEIIEKSLGPDANKFVALKSNEIGVKITELTKLKAEKLEKYDVVDILIEFNNCWYMGGKIYMSFVLKDVKISDEKHAPKETPFLFTDIE